MADKPTFSALKDAQNNVKVFEITAGLPMWTLAEDYIAGPVKLKIEAVDQDALWQYAPDQYCKAGGTTRNDLAAILPAAPIGALIAKVGGSSADFPPPAGAGGQPGTLLAGIKLFAVGAYAVVEIKDTESGPLFLAMNDTLAGFPHHAGTMKVKISLAPVA